MATTGEAPCRLCVHEKFSQCTRKHWNSDGNKLVFSVITIASTAHEAFPAAYVWRYHSDRKCFERPGAMKGIP